MPEGVKEGQDKPSYVDRVTRIVTDFAKTTGGVWAAALIDQEGEVVGYYSEIPKGKDVNVLGSIGTATANNITNLKNELKSFGVTKEVEEMELVIEDLRVFTLKIVKNYDYALCVICPIDGGAKGGTIKGKFRNSMKDEIISVLKEQKFITESKEF